MIEQVGGGGGEDVPRGCATIFVSVFQSYYIFVSVAFNSPMPFLGRFYQYLHICLLYIMCISSKSQTVFWAQNKVRTEIKMRFKIYMVRTKFSLISNRNSLLKY